MCINLVLVRGVIKLNPINNTKAPFLIDDDGPDDKVVIQLDEGDECGL